MAQNNQGDRDQNQKSSPEGGAARHGGPKGDSDEQSQTGGRRRTKTGTQQDGDKGDRSQGNAREGGQSGGNKR